MCKKLSAKYYQGNKKRLQKKTHEIYQNVSKVEKEKNYNMVVNVTKILFSITSSTKTRVKNKTKKLHQ